MFSVAVKYIPSWVSGASFQVKGRAKSKLATDMKDVPFKALMAELVGNGGFDHVAES